MAIESEYAAQSDAIADGDLVGMVDVSDGSMAATGTRKKSTASQWWTYIRSKLFTSPSEIGGTLADGDSLVMSDASDSGTVKTTLLSRIATYIQTALPIAAGTWTPTCTSVANLDGNPTATGYYLRVLSIVIAWAEVTIDPTLAATTTRWLMSPAVASNFTVSANAIGAVLSNAFTSAYGFADATANEIELLGTNGALTTSFGVRVITMHVVI
jgi:hypothetical protein